MNKIHIIFFFFVVFANAINAQILLGSKYRYKIESVHSGKVIDVPWGSSDIGTAMIQWSYSGSDNQKWYFSDAGNGNVFVHSANSFLILDIKDTSLVDGAKLVQNYKRDAPNQQFFLEKIANNEYFIKAKHSGKVWDIKDQSTASNAEIIQNTKSTQNSQKWRIILIDSVTVKHSVLNPGLCVGIGNQYKINARSNYFDLWDIPWADKKAGVSLGFWSADGINQRFFLEETGNDFYFIRPLNNGSLVLQPKNGSFSQNTILEQNKKTGEPIEQYAFRHIGDGFYTIYNVKTNLVLTKEGNQIIHSKDIGSLEQQWKLILSEGECNGISTGITNITQYQTNLAANTCKTVKMFYVVPSDAPNQDRQALCAAAARSQQRNWAENGYTIVIEPIKVVKSTQNMNWFMTESGNDWYSYGVNAENEVKKLYPIDYSKDKILLFVEGVCSAAAGGGGSASIPGCMIDRIAKGDNGHYGVIGHELGHHMFGTGHINCETHFPQDNMCNGAYPANFIYPGSYTDKHIDSGEYGWLKEKSNCNVTIKKCNIGTPITEYQIDSGNWQISDNQAIIKTNFGKKLTLSMNPNGLSYYRWYGPDGLVKRGDKDGNLFLTDSLTSNQLGMYRCLGINDEGCTVHTDFFIIENKPTSTSEISSEQITIYPNPVSNVLIINILEKENTNVSHQIFDLSGKKLDCDIWQNTINTSNLSNGVYFLKIQIAEKTITKKFVVLR